MTAKRKQLEGSEEKAESENENESYMAKKNIMAKRSEEMA